MTGFEWFAFVCGIVSGAVIATVGWVIYILVRVDPRYYKLRERRQ